MSGDQRSFKRERIVRRDYQDPFVALTQISIFFRRYIVHTSRMTWLFTQSCREPFDSIPKIENFVPEKRLNIWPNVIIGLFFVIKPLVFLASSLFFAKTCKYIFISFLVYISVESSIIKNKPYNRQMSRYWTWSTIQDSYADHRTIVDI